MMESVALDDKDRAILRLLQREGRISAAALAQEIALSESACRRRIEALERAGIITGYRAELDAQALGYSLTVFVSITLGSQTQKELAGFEAAVRAAPEILECWLMTGDADYLIRVAARDVTDLERIHREVLTRLPGVIRVNTALAMRPVVRPRGLTVR